MKLLALIGVSLLAMQNLRAQSVFFELGGPGVASFNFDSRFNGKQSGLGGRVGVGGYTSFGDSQVWVPIEVNYLAGKDNKHYFEMGAGVTFGSRQPSSDDQVGAFTNTFGHLYFGYRLQPENGGFLFRAGICPVFGRGYFIPYYPAISFGYTFGKHFGVRAGE